ncbi:hypothetical protein SAMN05428970_3169 [Agromyces sp. CF514]|nr:hypothetical protein SAMN05428970_3169 [Agromyces sp. CF514]
MPAQREQPSITIQSVLFHTRPDALERALGSINRAAEYGWQHGTTSVVRVSYGDCSPTPMVDEELLESWRARFEAIERIDVAFFGENLGHGGAQNRVFDTTETDLMVIANPDVVASADALSGLAEVLRDPTVGIVEAKQLPIEHPKDYDSRTGATSWCSGAFSMLRTSTYREVGGFDAERFFMYGDDVDLSWRIRLGGLGAVVQPAAAVFHDKRLTHDGSWNPTDAERYYSAEAALILAQRWSRFDIVDDLVAQFEHGGPIERRALAEFRRRLLDGSMQESLDPHHQTADFTDGTYGRHRYAL